MAGSNGWNFDAAEPPAGLSDVLQSLWWLQKGDLKLGPAWETAHELCQIAEGTHDYDWVHGLAHWIEGDEWNANYWYHRCGEARRGATVLEEWDALVQALS